MKLRSSIAAAFFFIALIYTAIQPLVAQWPVFLLLFIYGLLLIVQEEWQDSLLQLLIVGLVLALFYYGAAPHPYVWLRSIGAPFGLAITGAILYIFTIVCSVLWLTHLSAWLVNRLVTQHK